MVCDAHNDCLTTLTKEEFKNYIEFCFNNKVVKIFTAYYVSPENEKLGFATLFTDIKKKYALIQNYPNLTLAFENIGYIDDIEQLQKLIALKPFSATLTWNYSNKLGGGAYGNGKLSNFGVEVVNYLEKQNIFVDIAHLNDMSIKQFMNITSKPLFCSHICSRDCNNILRNIPTFVLREIGDSRGFVGLCLYNTLLTNLNRSSFEDIRKHLDCFIENAGSNCVGLGTDFNGTFEENPTLLHDYNGLDKLYEYLSLYYSKDTLDKIFYKNLLGFIKSNNYLS